jgi:hypothetical protein
MSEFIVQRRQGGSPAMVRVYRRNRKRLYRIARRMFSMGHPLHAIASGLSIPRDRLDANLLGGRS